MGVGVVKEAGKGGEKREIDYLKLLDQLIETHAKHHKNDSLYKGSAGPLVIGVCAYKSLCGAIPNRVLMFVRVRPHHCSTHTR